MKALYLTALLVCGAISAQNTIVSTEEIPLTKVQHYGRYCDAAFVDEEVQNPGKNLDYVKKLLWQKEENYWKFVKEYDLVSYLRLWDDHFLGYRDDDVPADKAHIVNWIDRMRTENKGVYGYNLTRKSENLFNDVAIVFYDVDQTWSENGKIVKKSALKIMRTWRFRSGDWFIIGSMQANR